MSRLHLYLMVLLVSCLAACGSPCDELITDVCRCYGTASTSCDNIKKSVSQIRQENAKAADEACLEAQKVSCAK